MRKGVCLCGQIAGVGSGVSFPLVVRVLAFVGLSCIVSYVCRLLLVFLPSFLTCVASPIPSFLFVPLVPLFPSFPRPPRSPRIPLFPSSDVHRIF